MHLWKLCSWKFLSVPAVAIALLACSPAAPAKVNLSFGVNLGGPPVCPYGYYDVAPYNCAPYGYYGPEWFPNGVFIGAGPWFHGPADFYGHVDNHFDPHHGYRGPYPHRGDFAHFHGNDMRDGRGHERADNGHDHH